MDLDITSLFRVTLALQLVDLAPAFEDSMEPLTDLGVQVAGEVATSLLAKIKKHFAYLYKYKHNLIELEEAKRQLDAKRSDAIKFSCQTGLSVRDVGSTIQFWQSDAEKLDQKAKHLISRNNISCLKLWDRYSTSKHAWELTQMINEKVKSAADFGMSFDRSVPEGAKFNLRGYMEFESRRRIQDEVLEALKRDDVTMCSICGMGGIGKTTLAKKLIKKVEVDCLFEKVAMVTVSQNPNFEEIQKGLIDSLGLKFEESTMQGRAKKLNDWLSNHMTLLIFDDVWWQLSDENFDDLGIPLASNQCKILFTSRNIDECKKMGSEPNFPLNVLDSEEALELFIQNAGKCVEERNLQDKARQIVDECRGLPIAIVTIAKALKDTPQGEWDDSLAKLQKSNLPGISDMEKVFSKINVSYDLLKDSEAQSCLRLCCLFPEDDNVPVEKLVFYGKGLEIFEGVERLKEARDRVDSIVHKLKSSFLLLDGDEDGCVKLHDIVRDFAIWISSKEKNPYLVICEKEIEKWPENCQYEKCSSISFVCQKIKNHPVSLRCPSLKLLHLDFCQDMLPKGFFDGMEDLRVIDIAVSTFPALTMPKALRTLLVTHDSSMDCSSYLREMLNEGNMKNLEILSLPWMELSEFPMEIRLMCNLRCLRFDEGSLKNIPPGVLSNLVQLEELELPPDFRDWGLKKEGRSNGSLDEIGSLPLTSITIGLRKGSILPENILKSITRFRIHIGKSGFQDFDFYSNLLVVRDVVACSALVNWTSNILRKCQKLDLRNVRLKYIMSQQLEGNNCYQCVHFSQLITLHLEGMYGLEEILHGTYLSNIQQPCFTNLTEIVIKECAKLKCAFPLSVAREFTQLESVILQDCSDMEEVFYDDQMDSENQITGESIEKVGEREVDHVVVLPRLRKLYLRGMPQLRVLYNGNHAIKCPSLDQLVFLCCGDIKDLSYRAKKLKLDGGIEGDLRNISKWLPFAQENGIQQIKELSIAKCHEMTYLADALASPNLMKTFFSDLEILTVGYMYSLEEIWHGPYLPKIHIQCFSTLTQIFISDCPKMKHLLPIPAAIELRQLKVLEILSCKEIEEIFYNDQVDDGNQLSSLLNDPTIESATPTPTPNKDEKSSVLCPTPTSFIQCLLPKGKQSKHLLSHQTIEENLEKCDEREDDCVIVWPRLERICLGRMPNLRVMCNGNHTIECPSLEELSIDECNNMEVLSYGSFSATKTEVLVLKGVRHLKNIAEWVHFEQDNGIPQLLCLQIESCHEMICLVDAITDPNLMRSFFSKLEELWIWNMDSLEEIWHGPYLSIVQPQRCFTHLTWITILDCPKLKHVFPLSAATELTQLQKLEISGCKEMKEIFYKNQVADGNQNASSAELNCPTASAPPYSVISTHQTSTEENTQKVDPAIVFPQLKVLSLRWMPELRVMYDGNCAIECPSLEELTMTDCNKMDGLSYVSFSAPKIKKLNLEDMNKISKRLHLKQENGIILEKLCIERCNGMTYLADAMTDRNLLNTLICNSEHLQICGLDSLEEIWHGPYLSITQPQPCFTHLTLINIRGCPKLKHVFPLSVATELTQLWHLRIERCEEMEEIFYKDRVGNGIQIASSVELYMPTTETASRPPCSTHQIIEENVGKSDEREVNCVTVWPRLKKLSLREIPKLRVMCNWDHAIECPSLEELTITDCNNMKGLSYGSFSSPKTKKLGLTEVRHLKNIVEWLHLEQDSGIPQLRELCIESCHEMIYLANATTDRNLLKTFFSKLKELWIWHMESLEEIWHGPYLSIVQEQPCFSHLTQINIFDCQKLKHIFPLSVATKLTHLQQ